MGHRGHGTSVPDECRAVLGRAKASVPGRFPSFLHAERGGQFSWLAAVASRTDEDDCTYTGPDRGVYLHRN